MKRDAGVFPRFFLLTGIDSIRGSVRIRTGINAMPQQLQEVYAQLGEVLNDPQAFGLGGRVPGALADRLISMRRMLREAMSEIEQDQPDGDLASELSEDADDTSIRPET